ncbi:hypothetical protein OS31_21400 [Dickeya oryzae]
MLKCYLNDSFHNQILTNIEGMLTKRRWQEVFFAAEPGQNTRGEQAGHELIFVTNITVSDWVVFRSIVAISRKGNDRTG